MKRKPMIGLLVAVGLGVSLGSVHAAAPMVKTQPGFFRLMLGEFEITALNDGVVEWPVSTLTGATPEQIRSGLEELRLSDRVGMSYNGYLVNTGSKLVLIDTGTGGKLQDSAGFRGAGRLLANLRAAGYQPEQVDEILITHTGPDHVGGLTIGAERAFPNATVHASKSEVEVYVDPSKAASALADSPDKSQAEAWFKFQRDLFDPYIRAGRLQMFDVDAELLPGIRSFATHGHTAGHTSYIIESKGQTLIVWGDLVHWQAVQFAYPSAYTSFDADPAGATKQRIRLFKLAVDQNDWVAGSHLAFPGVGHVRAGQGRYFWIPAPYGIPSQ